MSDEWIARTIEHLRGQEFAKDWNWEQIDLTLVELKELTEEQEDFAAREYYKGRLIELMEDPKKRVKVRPLGMEKRKRERRKLSGSATTRRRPRKGALGATGALAQYDELDFSGSRDLLDPGPRETASGG